MALRLYERSSTLRAMYHFSAPRAWRRDLLRVLLSGRAAPASPDVHLRAALEWLARAQDASGASGGVAAMYTARAGWIAPYPETTGYILCTFYDHAKASKEEAYSERARRMAEWLLSIQNDDGSFPGGPLRNRGQPPVVFDVGQILQGLVRAHEETRDERYLSAARRAGDWLLDAQDSDGAWRRHEYHGTAHAYNARVAWPLASLYRATGEVRYGESAERFGRWTLARQRESGWFEASAFRRDEVPLTHTIAYTIEGLYELGHTLKAAEFTEAARKAALAILERYESSDGRYDGAPPGLIPARLEEAWRGTVRYACLTGCAQIALVWLRMAEEGEEERPALAARRLLDALRGHHDVRARDPAVRGALAGSHPFSGGYISCGFPNWAAKFLADALLAEARLARRPKVEVAA